MDLYYHPATLQQTPTGQWAIGMHDLSREEFDRLPGPEYVYNGKKPYWYKTITPSISVFTNEPPRKE